MIMIIIIIIIVIIIIIIIIIIIVIYQFYLLCHWCSRPCRLYRSMEVNQFGLEVFQHSAI